MGSNYQEESSSMINSSEEVDSSDQENNDDNTGVGRSYECVFCKRGFNTAQALGGHMNIHRKDRARSTTKPTSSSNNIPNKQFNNYYSGPRLYEQILEVPPVYMSSHRGSVVGSSNGQECLISCNNDSVGSTTSSYVTRPLLYGNEFGRGMVSSNVPVDWRLRLSWEYSSDGDLEKKRRYGMSNHEKEEVDLELRLGYD